MAETRTVQSYCRTCLAACGVTIEVEGDRVVKVQGDPSHPLSRGYSCPKGRAAGELHHHPDRLNHPLLRRGDEMARVSWDELLGDLGAKLRALREEHGDDAVGIYLGTGGGSDSLGMLVGRMLLASLGTRSFYSAMTIDTPCLPLVSELMSGSPVSNPVLDLEHTRMTLIIGSNPMVSHGHKTAFSNPSSMLRTLMEEGREMWVVDPRQTATARMATRHLAPHPTTDHALLAYLVRELLGPDGGAARAHLAAHALDVEVLERAVAPWDLARTSEATGLDLAELEELLAAIRRHGRLAVLTGTGTSMQRRANVVEWLAWALQIVTDSFGRRGGMWFSPGASNRYELMEAFAEPAFRDVPGPASRPELSGHLGEMPCSAMIDEIEAGNLRALIVLGANPPTAFPDTERITRALQSLEVLAVTEILPTETTAVATHVLPATDPLERSDFPGYLEGAYVDVLLQVAPRVFEPAAERRQTWWALAKLGELLGSKILPGGISADDASDEALIRMLMSAGRLDYDAVAKQSPPSVVVEGVKESLRGWVYDKLPQGRWRVAPAPLVAQLEAISEESSAAPGTLRFISGRQLRQMNSALRKTAAPGERLDEARVHLHAQDAAEAGIEDGATVRVSSATGSVEGRAKIDPALRPGAVWIPHGWPELSVSRLTSHELGVDPLTGMVEQSGFAVRVQPVAGAPA